MLGSRTVGIMGTSRTFRRWIKLTLFLAFMVPAWMSLGSFLGYDIMPAPDPDPIRYSSESLGLCYYIVLFVLGVLALFWMAWSVAIFLSGTQKQYFSKHDDNEPKTPNDS